MPAPTGISDVLGALLQLVRRRWKGVASEGRGNRFRESAEQRTPQGALFVASYYLRKRFARVAGIAVQSVDQAIGPDLFCVLARPRTRGILQRSMNLRAANRRDLSK